MADSYIREVIPGRLYQVDTGFFRRAFSAVWIVRSGQRVVLVESGSTLSVPKTLQALADLGIARDDVAFVFITHAHLDHMGGTGLVMQSLPKASVVCHAAAAPHIIDPHAKLCPAAVAVYGQEVFDQDYPGVVGLDASRVVIAANDSVRGAGDDPALQLRCLEAFGHAFHHMVYLSEDLGVLFSGDGLGFSFQELRGCPILNTSPTQFDSGAWRKTLLMVEALQGVRYIAPAHFEVRDYTAGPEELRRHIDCMRRQLDAYDRIIETCGTRDEVREALKDSALAFAKEYGSTATRDEIYALVTGEVNTSGIWYRIQRRKEKGGAAK